MVTTAFAVDPTLEGAFVDAKNDDDDDDDAFSRIGVGLLRVSARARTSKSVGVL